MNVKMINVRGRWSYVLTLPSGETVEEHNFTSHAAAVQAATKAATGRRQPKEQK